MDTANPLFTVGSTLRLPITQRAWPVDRIDQRASGIYYRFNLLAEPFRADKWYSETDLLKLNRKPATVTVLPPPVWSNLLYHPTMTAAPAIITTISETAPVPTPWLADLRRARNLIYRASDGVGNSKLLLTVRLELVEGQGVIAEAARALPEYAGELALAVGEIAAARVVEDKNAVKFLSHKAGYRVNLVVERMVNAKREQKAEAA